MAFFKGSRYESARRFDGEGQARPRFRGVQPRTPGTPEPVLEHTVAVRERLDTLGHHYFADPRLWYRIAEANPDALFAEDLLFEAEPADEHGREKMAAIILIPRAREI